MKKLFLLKRMLLLCALIVGCVNYGWAETGTITFSTNDVKIDDTSVTGNDTQGNTWTITTAGTTSFTPNSAYYQVGSSKKPATSITFTTTLAENVNITAFSATFGGFSGTEGTITLKVGETEVGSGSLSGATDVTVSSTKAQDGKVLTVTVTGIAKGVKVYNISYTYEAVSSGETTTTTISAAGITNTNKSISTSAGSLSASVTYGDPAAAVPEATVTWSGDNDDVATINSTTGAVTLVGAGKVTFTASYAGVTDEYKSSSDTYEMTVTDEDPSLVTIWSEDFSDYSANDVPSGGTYSYVCVNGNSATMIYTQNLAGGESPELLINKKGTNNGSFSATIPLNNGYTGTLKLQFKNNNTINVSAKDNNGNYLLESTSVSANTTTGSSVNIAGVTAETISVTIEWSNSSSSNVRLDDIVLRGKEVPAKPTLTITTNAGKWASFTPEWNCTLEDGAKAYIITGVNGSTLTGEEVAVLEGGKGYFIKGEVASHPYTATATDADATSTEGNLVVGCATNTEINGSGNTKYILGTNDSGAGLFYVDSSITIPAGKAYLDAGKVIDTPARALSLDFEEGETTSLNEVRGLKAEVRGEYFNLNGQRVAQPTKGLYIVNGRKVVIK